MVEKDELRRITTIHLEQTFLQKLDFYTQKLLAMFKWGYRHQVGTEWGCRHKNKVKCNGFYNIEMLKYNTVLLVESEISNMCFLLIVQQISVF